VDGPQQRESGLWGWLNCRTGLDNLFRSALDEPIPGGARFAYVFGSALLFIFISQVITGIFLALYYVPSADHAHTTVAYITKAVTAGSFLRALHAYGASAMVVVLFLHLSQTYIYGSYKGRRELLWLSGCALFGLVLAMAFTGYLLPWDQRAYFATAVGTNAVSEIPWIGESIKRLMRGGTEMGTLTISRFFVAHVFLIPAFIFALVASHIFLFRKAGAAGPVNEDPYHPKQKAELFYPRQVLMDLSLTALLIIGLGWLCFFAPMQLGPPANPADAQYVPRPEWYYLPIFQWLKYWHGSAAVIGVLVIPMLLVLAILALPFLDRGIERRPWKRPAAMGAYVFVVFMLLGLGLRIVEIEIVLAGQREPVLDQHGHRRVCHGVTLQRLSLTDNPFLHPWTEFDERERLRQPEFPQQPNENRVDEDHVNRMRHRDPPCAATARRKARSSVGARTTIGLSENLVHFIPYMLAA
jgi:quinol-cytochrome oxidoreductase complex cytochrome b subunit